MLKAEHHAVQGKLTLLQVISRRAVGIMTTVCTCILIIAQSDSRYNLLAEISFWVVGQRI
jgi:hypothetical protein